MGSRAGTIATFSAWKRLLPVRRSRPNYQMARVRGSDSLAWVACLALASGCGRLGIEVLEVGPDEARFPTTSRTTADGGSSGLGQPACADGADQDDCDDDTHDAGAVNGGDGCSAASSAGDCACRAAPPGPIAHYRFDDGSGTLARDDLSGASDGVLRNFAERTWTTGRVGGALGFDGVDDYVHVADASLGVRSLSFWLKPESLHTTLDQTEWLSPTTYGPSNQWSNPERAFVADGSSASSGISLATKHQHWGGFGVQLPPGVSVRGIAVSVTSSTFNLLSNFGGSLSWDGGSSHTASKGEFALLGLGAETQVAGGENDTWGRAFTPEELSDANFRVRASFQGLLGSMAIDHVQVKVYHTPYEQGRGLLSLGEATHVQFGSGAQLALSGWEGASVYVNGVLGAPLGDDWNHVVITGPQVVGGSEFHIGYVPGERFAQPFHGALDDLRVFEETLSADHVRTLFECGD